jgi:dihydrofolate synthase/folylpolyglutamate synthase
MAIDPSYQDALDYIYSYVDYSLTRSFRYSPEKFDLDRMRDLMMSLGHPEQAYASIHIAGTKGKGSVAAMCSSALQANGYRVGLYTSPHMSDFAERIQVDGENIPYQDLIAILEEIKPQIEAVPAITTFEITTALAFYYFQKRGIDVGVFEVGLGGRLDATNVLRPNVTVITSVSYDHTEILGDTLASIAREKAGIIKENIPLVLAPQKVEAREVIEQIAATRSASLTLVEGDYAYELEDKSIAGQSFRIWPVIDPLKGKIWSKGAGNPVGGSTHLEIPLLGYHQVQNAATAYATLKVFQEVGFALEDEAIVVGFKQVNWPGRFEILQANPPVIVDSAHNRDSAGKLRRTLDDYFPQEKVVLILGASEDKDIGGMFAELADRVGEVLATRSYHPRAMEPERIVEVVESYQKPVRIVMEVPDALDEAIRISSEDTIVLASGSLFIAAGIREAWFARQYRENQPLVEENK